MVKSISELFGSSDRLIKLPSNEGTAYDPISKTGSWIESGIGSYKENLETKAFKTLTEVMSKYDEIKNDPTEALRIFNHIKRPSDAVNEKGKVAGDKIIDIPGYMSKEDGALLNWALGTLSDVVNSASGGRAVSNYPLLMLSQINTGNSMANKAINGLVNSLTDAFKEEAEKGTIPWKIPNNKLDEVRNTIFEVVKTNASKGVFGSLMSAAKTVIQKLSGIDETGVPAGLGLYNKLSFAADQTNQFDYAVLDDPYRTQDELLIDNTLTYESAIDSLVENKLLSGYKDYAGFEMGSNHQWKIELYPYPHEYEDVIKYENQLNRFPCTPGLPFYYLPNLWKETKEVKTSVKVEDKPIPFGGLQYKTINDDGSEGKQKNEFGLDVSKSHIISGCNDDQGPIPEPGGNLIDKAKDLVNSAVSSYKKSLSGSTDVSGGGKESFDDASIFSFSTNCPVLSYDFSLGTVKTESLPLFNGSQSEVFAGMQYNSILNMSILDDVYGSMFKYMMTYINCCYDVHTHSLAPYYNCAFQINLTILRPGGQINHMYKFIGVPIEYTPRLDGSQDANECRIDITFGIIGFIPYRYGRKLYSDKDKASKLGGRTDCDDPGAKYLNPHGGEESDGKSTNISDLTWQDIQINM